MRNTQRECRKSLNSTTPPPFDYVEQELVNGRLDKIIDNSVHKVLDNIEL